MMSLIFLFLYIVFEIEDTSMIKNNHPYLLKAFAIALLGSLTFAFSASASAGMDVTTSLTGNCYLSGTTEVCYGTMAGIRNQTSDNGRDARFGFTMSSGYFYMGINGTSYFCSAPSSMNESIKLAMTASGYFQVQFNINTGVCTYIALETGSSEKNASNL